MKEMFTNYTVSTEIRVQILFIVLSTQECYEKALNMD